MGTSYSFITLLEECSYNYRTESQLTKLFRINPENCDLVHRDVNNFLVLTALIYFEMDSLVLHILDYYTKNDPLKLYTIIRNDLLKKKTIKFEIQERYYADTPLTMSIHKKFPQIALKLFDNPNICDIGTVNAQGNNALMLSAENNMSIVAFKLFEHRTKCKLGTVNKKGDTVLMIAIRSGLLQLVLSLLDHCDQCKVEQINNKGESALTLALDKDLCHISYKLYNRDKSIEYLSLKQVDRLTKILDSYEKLPKKN